MFRISKPCHENWDDMTQQERGRHCAVCDKQVVDFTQMSQAQSEKILKDAAAQSSDCQTGICGRVHADQKGVLRLGSRRPRLLTDSLAAMLALTLLGGCQDLADESTVQGNIEGTSHPIEQPHEHPIKGDICVDPPVPVQIPEPMVMGEICEMPAEIKPAPVVEPEQILKGKIHIETE